VAFPLLLINVRIEIQRGYPSKELFLRSDKLIPLDMPAGRQEICFVLQNSAIRCAEVPFLVKIFVDTFLPFQKHTHTHTHTHHFQRTIVKKNVFLDNWKTSVPSFLLYIPFLHSLTWLLGCKVAGGFALLYRQNLDISLLP
jgi:hypothetical protein